MEWLRYSVHVETPQGWLCCGITSRIFLRRPSRATDDLRLSPAAVDSHRPVRLRRHHLSSLDRHGRGRIAFPPEKRNDFRPETADELATALDHAKADDVGGVLRPGTAPPRRTAAGPSVPAVTRAFAVKAATSTASRHATRTRERGAKRPTRAERRRDDDAPENGGRLHILEVQRQIRLIRNPSSPSSQGGPSAAATRFTSSVTSRSPARSTRSSFRPTPMWPPSTPGSDLPTSQNRSVRRKPARCSSAGKPTPQKKPWIWGWQRRDSARDVRTTA